MSYLRELTAGLEVVGVADAGVPNQERVVLRPRYTVSLAGHGLSVGIPNPGGGAFPLHDAVFWFPELIVQPPAWLFVYTGTGVQRQTQMPNGDPALTFHWNRPHTVFNSPSLVAIVFRAMEVELGEQWPRIDLLGDGSASS